MSSPRVTSLLLLATFTLTGCDLHDPEGYAQVGLERDGVFNVLIPPYYASLGVNLRF